MHQFNLWAYCTADSSFSRKKRGKCGFPVFSKEQEVRGIEISANHLKVFAKESLRGLHELFTKEERFCGNKITDEEGNLISLCKLTNIVLDKTEQIIVARLLLIKLRFIIK
jgi:hypothetical protein